MPATATAQHPKTGLKITFKENDHSYIDETGHHYTSVTTLVHDCFPKFDAEEIAPKIAAKHGVTPESLIAGWEKKRDEACEYGTRVHEVAENVMLGKLDQLHKPRDEKERKAFAVAYDEALSLKNSMHLVGTEVLVFSPRYYIAGTIDLLMREGNTLWILDWKTNEKIEMTNNWGRFGLGTLAHRPDCNFEHYTLQLNIYRRIFIEEGYLGLLPGIEQISLGLIHIPHMADAAVLIPVDVREMDTAEAIINHMTNVPF